MLFEKVLHRCFENLCLRYAQFLAPAAEQGGDLFVLSVGQYRIVLFVVAILDGCGRVGLRMSAYTILAIPAQIRNMPSAVSIVVILLDIWAIIVYTVDVRAVCAALAPTPC